MPTRRIKNLKTSSRAKGRPPEERNSIEFNFKSKKSPIDVINLHTVVVGEAQYFVASRVPSTRISIFVNPQLFTLTFYFYFLLLLFTF